jgi:hypothetical protein
VITGVGTPIAFILINPGEELLLQLQNEAAGRRFGFVSPNPSSFFVAEEGGPSF